MAQQHDLAREFRARSGRLLARLTAQCRDLQLAEDALQEAFEQAHRQWPTKGEPDNPEAWLFTVARRRLMDHLRRASRKQNESSLAQIAAELSPHQRHAEDQHPIPDERLRLIFTCCHPALTPQAQVALTLKTLCGLSVREIARAYLTSEAAMNQRLVRAKQKIKRAGIAYEVPEAPALKYRLDSVLSTLYLIYNESYAAFEGQTLTRRDLAEEAIRLTEVLYRLLPEPSVGGLLALMLLHQARNTSRQSSIQSFIPLEFQDRSLWDAQRISHGRRILLSVLSRGKPEKYQLQAAISALHCEAPRWADTDWAQIILLYKTLLKIEPSPVIELNYLVALAQTQKIRDAHRQMITLADSLHAYQPYYAALASTEMSLGMFDDARQHFMQAAKLSRNNAERSFFDSQLNKLGSR